MTIVEWKPKSKKPKFVGQYLCWCDVYPFQSGIITPALCYWDGHRWKTANNLKVCVWAKIPHPNIAVVSAPYIEQEIPMTDEIRGVRDRQWNYGNLHGLITGLNTAELYLKWANENPKALPELLEILEEILSTTEEQYQMVKADAKQYMKEHLGEEDEDGEQQTKREEV